MIFILLKIKEIEELKQQYWRNLQVKKTVFKNSKLKTLKKHYAKETTKQHLSLEQENSLVSQLMSS